MRLCGKRADGTTHLNPITQTCLLKLRQLRKNHPDCTDAACRVSDAFLIIRGTPHPCTHTENPFTFHQYALKRRCGNAKKKPHRRWRHDFLLSVWNLSGVAGETTRHSFILPWELPRRREPRQRELRQPPEPRRGRQRRSCASGGCGRPSSRSSP